MPPHGIDLARYATISADLAEGDRPFSDVLQSHGLTEAQWSDAMRFWSDRMTTDARDSALAGMPPRVTLFFSDVFVRVQDAKRPLPPLDVRGWAELKRDVDARGPGKSLSERGLSLADYSRLVRHWTKRMANDPAVREAMSAFEDV